MDFRNSALWLCRKDEAQGKQQLSIQIFQLQESGVMQGGILADMMREKGKYFG